MKEIIRLDDIRRDFRVGDETVHALRGVTFTICEGEFVTIMGTSGSGKSTLLNTLGCLDTPSAGEYYLDGTAVRSMDKNQRATLRNRKIGFVFQNYNLLPKTTAIENVELPLMYNPSCSSAERRDRAVAALKAVGLGDRLLHRSNQMSGGQMQRVAIARALVNDPAVILADEATGEPRHADEFRGAGALPAAARRGTHHHLRHAQPRNRTIQQPQHHPARRPRHGRHTQRRYSRRGRDAGSAARTGGLNMNFTNLFKIAVKALGNNKLRGFLTMLGIIIGVASVITMLAIGQGSKRSIQAEISEMGSNMIMIHPGGDMRGGVRLDADDMESLKLKDMEDIREKTRYVSYVSPAVNSAGQKRSTAPTTRPRRSTA